MSVSLAQSPQGVDFPWRLRIEHEGLLSLRMERKGRTIRFNPMHPPESTDIVILTGTWPEHLDATAAAVSAGNRPTVIAPQAVLDWLTTRGELSGHSGSTGHKLPNTASRSLTISPGSIRALWSRAVECRVFGSGIITTSATGKHLRLGFMSNLLYCSLIGLLQCGTNVR